MFILSDSSNNVFFFSVLGTSFDGFINVYFWVFKFLVFEILYQPLLEENE